MMLMTEEKLRRFDAAFQRARARQAVSFVFEGVTWDLTYAQAVIDSAARKFNFVQSWAAYGKPLEEKNES